MKKVRKIVEDYIKNLGLENITEIVDIKKIGPELYEIKTEEQDVYGNNFYTMFVKNGKLYDSEWNDVYSENY